MVDKAEALARDNPFLEFRLDYLPRPALALVKVKRRGIEYGIGAIPLGGFVRIPGMHRPAGADLTAFMAPALREEPGLAPAVQFIDRARVDKVNQRTCVPTGCYDGVLVVDEWDPTAQPQDGHQFKYHAPGVGVVKIEAKVLS